MKKVIFAAACLVSCGLQALEYQLQFENDQISVAKVKIMPHEEIGLHRDVCPQIVIALQGGTITRLEADGRTTDVQFPAGVAVYRTTDPVGELHRSVNRSHEPVELIIIQLKSEEKIHILPVQDLNAGSLDQSG